MDAHNANNGNAAGGAAVQNGGVEANGVPNIDDVFNLLDPKFLDEYENIEVASNLPDGNYTMVVTKSEVLPVNRPHPTINLKFTARVQMPETLAGKIFQFDFTLSENNKLMMKRMFYNLGFEFDLKNQLAAFARLQGCELEINLSTKDQYQNKNIRRMTQKGELLQNFLSSISVGDQL